MTLILKKTKKYGNFHVDKESMHLFWYFVWSRQEVYYKRFVENLPPPWTEDSILNEYKFTNICRELDRTTIWYHDNIGKMENKNDIIFATFVHRLFNNIPTMQALMPHLTIKAFNPGIITELLETVRAQGNNVYTTAHMTTGVRFGGYSDKLHNIIYLINLIHQDIDNICKNILGATSLEDLYNRTRMVNGFGPFLAYQFILDMVNTGVHKFSLDSFVVAGPGCKRGIRHVFPDGNEISFEKAMMYMRENQHRYFEKYGFDFKFLKELGGKEKGIHLGNIENSFCEYSKYHKSYHGTGRPRNKFMASKEKIRVIK